MDNKIDLDAIITDHCSQPFMDEEGCMVVIAEGMRDALKEAIKQALVIASEKAKVKEVSESSTRAIYDGLDSVRIYNPNGPDSHVSVDQQSILDVNDLIVQSFVPQKD